MSENKTGRYLKYAIGEIILVMVGILLALQVNNWNENRKKVVQEQFILEKLKVDIASDLTNISDQMELINTMTKELTFCLDVILGKQETNLQIFRKNLNSLLSLISFDQNRTTFNNIVSSGQIEFIQNQTLTDSITKYYNHSYKGWDTAMLDYTRNIMAPFMLDFDHIPQGNVGLEEYESFTSIDINKSKIVPKTIEDYRDEVFFLNILRQKVYNLEGQEMEYEKLKMFMKQLLKQINAEIET